MERSILEHDALIVEIMIDEAKAREMLVSLVNRIVFCKDNWSRADISIIRIAR